LKINLKNIQTIYKGAPSTFLEVLGKIIRKEFAHIKLIGEIERPEGEDTFHALRDCLHRYFRFRFINRFDPDRSDLDNQNARAVISLFFVWTGIFEYGEDQGNELWPHIFNGMKLPHDPNVSGKG
jgi:hypothetical protein